MKFAILAILLTVGCKEEVTVKADAPAPVVVEEPSPPQPEPKIEPDPLTDDEKKKVESIASGMMHIKKKRDHGFWYACGSRLDESEQRETSLQIARQTVLNIKSLGADFDPWGVVGTMFNESHFDPCAFGKNPRAAALEFGLFKRERRGFSHGRENILRAIVDPRMRKRFKVSGYDLGLCQILTRFYPKEVADMTTVDGGVRICVLEMQSRAQYNKTKTPWLYWRGSKTPWYLSKIRRWVKIMKKGLVNGNDETRVHPSVS